MISNLRCPYCKGPSTWEENPHRPFCCERCRMIDMGRWLKGEYSLPDESQNSTLSEEELAAIEKASKDPIVH